MKRACSLLRFFWGVIAILFLAMPSFSYNLSILQIDVDDNTHTIYCHPNFGNFEIKGNNDKALSPGERVSLYVIVKNQSGYDITGMYGIMFENSPYINVINPNCYSGQIGVRYLEGGSLPDGQTISNFDPFIVEVSQDTPCHQFIDFEVTFYFTTSSGDCSTQCSETHHFSLPVFSFDKPFVTSDEEPLFESATDRNIIDVATNGQSIGIFFSPDQATLYFSEMSLDGAPLTGPIEIAQSTSYSIGKALWNYTNNQYEFIGYDGTLISQDGYWIRNLQPPDEGVTLNILDTFYDTKTFPGVDTIVVLSEAPQSDAHLYLIWYRASHQLFDKRDTPIQSVDLGQCMGDVVRNYSVSLKARYDESIHSYIYYVAYEYWSNTEHTLNLQKIEATNPITIYPPNNSITLDSSSDCVVAMPSLSIDEKHRAVALAYQKKVGDFFKIFGVTANEDLTSLSPETVLVDGEESGKQKSSPLLIYNNDNFYLVNFDIVKNQYNPEQGAGKIQLHTCNFSIDQNSTPIAPVIPYSTYTSNAWLGMKNLRAILSNDKLYYFWNDTRASTPNNLSMHYGSARFLSPYAPYNIDPDDDSIISQLYEHSLHPSIACKENDCLVAWRNQSGFDGMQGVFYKTFNLDGTPNQTDPILIQPENNEDAQTDAHPIVKNHNGNYEIFFKAYNNTSGKYEILKWPGSENKASTIIEMEGDASSTKLMDVAPGDGDDVILVTDKKSGDLCPNLYVYDCPHNGTLSFVKLTDYNEYSSIGTAKIVKIENGPYPYAVASFCHNPYAQLWFSYMNANFTLSGNPQIIGTWWYPEYPSYLNISDIALSSNSNAVLLAASFPQYDQITNTYTCKFQLREYPHPFDLSNCTIYDLREQNFEGQFSPYIMPSIKWTGTYFDLTWAEDGRGTLSYGRERLFFIDHLDECGNFLSLPVRIGSYLSYGGSLGFDLNYEAERTKNGFLATYSRGSGSNSFNVHLTPLSWDNPSMVCNLFNSLPVVSTTGPFTIEYGSGVTLSGNATDDTAMGDYIASSGWDITQDGVVDFYGLNPTISFEQLKQKGWIAPGTKEVMLIAVDRNNAQNQAITTLTIRDTTPPYVNISFPNGGETLIENGSYTILWDGSDNYKIDHYDLYYCTNFNGTNCNWTPIVQNLPETTHSYQWVVPQILSSNCRIKVVAVDGSTTPNSKEDISDNNFYIVQATTSSIKTLILRNNTRMDGLYPGQSSLISEKLAKLMVNSKVNGFIVEVDSIPGVPSLYSLWDSDPTNQSKANDVANAIRDYVKNLINNTYTNVEYLVIVGDDRIIPFFRIQDNTPGSYSEDDYIGEVDCYSTVGSAICQNYYLTDNNYGDLGHYENGIWQEYETTSAGVHYMALPDLAIGRLVEAPEEIATTIDDFITLDGQINLDSLTTADIFTSGYDFLNDSAQSINDLYDANYVVDNLIGNSWTADTLENELCLDPQTINSLNSHANHYSLICPDRWLQTSEIDGDYPAQIFNGSVFYNAGCHSGLNVPPTFTDSFDIPELMMKKGALSYIGNTGFGWGLKQGIGYTERLMQLVTQKMLSNNTSSPGKSLNEAKREYFVEDKRYDVYDEKVLFESTLYGLPMYKIVMSTSGLKEEPKDFSGPDGPDEEEINGIKLKKKFTNSANNNLLPPGVTELSLQFEFGPGTYQLVHTADGDYYRLNGKSNGEAGDSLQPLFIYESKLSGVTSKGVVFSGGTFANYSPFDPAIAAPQSSSPAVPPEPIAPVGTSFIPTVNVIHPRQVTSFATTDLTKLTVYTGYFDSNLSKETLFNTMNFSIYYSNSSDVTAPVIVDPGQSNNLHTLNGTSCTFSVSATDSGSGIYRVLVTYTDGISLWNSLDLTYNQTNSKWEKTLTLKRDIVYFVQAVDNAGNAKVLKVNENLGDINPETGLPYVTGAKIFAVHLLDNDSDGMEDTWETQNGLNPNLNDANSDLDYDGLTNYDEFMNDTLADNADTDGDGDNDGSELHNGRNPLNSSDGKRITITVEKVGDNIILHFENLLGENSVIYGPYWVYRSLNDPHFDENEILATTPFPLPDGTQTYTDVGAGSGSDTYYYTVVNARFFAPAPTIDAVVPVNGPTTGGTSITIYGSNFRSGATVKIGGVDATNVVVINDTKITCKTPANSSGSKDVVVTNLNGQFGTLTNGFTYY